MALGYVEPGYVKPGYVKSAVAVTVTIPSGERVTAATAYGDAGALETLFHQNPGPYAGEVIVSFQFQSGLYLYGFTMPNAAVQADAMDRSARLLSLGDLPLTSAPMGHDLIASIGASEITRVTMVFDNSNLEWSMRLAREPVLLASCTIWLFYGSTNLRKSFTGQVTVVELTGAEVLIEVGEP